MKSAIQSLVAATPRWQLSLLAKFLAAFNSINIDTEGSIAITAEDSVSIDTEDIDAESSIGICAEGFVSIDT